MNSELDPTFGEKQKLILIYILPWYGHRNMNNSESVTTSIHRLCSKHFMRFKEPNFSEILVHQNGRKNKKTKINIWHFTVLFGSVRV